MDFDQTKGYVIALDAMYVKIQELEDQIEDEKLNDEEKQEKKQKQQTNLKMMKQLPLGSLLMKGKEVTKKAMTQKEHKDTTTRMEIKWIETRN